MNRLIISIFLLSWILLGCGQKGDLYIPQDDAVAQPAPNKALNHELKKEQEQDGRKKELPAEQQPQSE